MHLSSIDELEVLQEIETKHSPIRLLYFDWSKVVGIMLECSLRIQVSVIEKRTLKLHNTRKF